MPGHSPEGGGLGGGGATATVARPAEPVAPPMSDGHARAPEHAGDPAMRTPMHERDIDTTVYHHADHAPSTFLEKQPESAREQRVKTLIDIIRTGEWREQQVGRRRYDKEFRDRAVRSLDDTDKKTGNKIPEFLNPEGDSFETINVGGGVERKYVKQSRKAEMLHRFKGGAKKQARSAAVMAGIGLATGGISWGALAFSVGASWLTRIGVEAYRTYSGKEAKMRERIVLARERINDKAVELANQVPEDAFPEGYNVDARMEHFRSSGESSWYDNFKQEYDKYAEYQVQRTNAIRELINFVCAVERDAVRFRQDAGGNPYIHSEAEGDIREEMPRRGEPRPTYEPAGKVMTRGTDALRNSDDANGDISLQAMEEEYAKYVSKMDKVETWLSAGAGMAAATGAFTAIKDGIMGHFLSHGHNLDVGGLSIDGHVVNHIGHNVRLDGMVDVDAPASELAQHLQFDYQNAAEALLSHGHGADVIFGEAAGQFGSHVMGETAGKAIDMLNTLALEYAAAELAAIGVAQFGLAGLENHQSTKKLEHDLALNKQNRIDNENERRGLLPPDGDPEKLDDAELHKRHIDKLKLECRALHKPFPADGDTWVRRYDDGAETRITVLEVTPDGHATVEIFQDDEEDNIIRVWPIERIFEQFEKRKGGKPAADHATSTHTTSSGGGGGGGSVGGDAGGGESSSEAATPPTTEPAAPTRRYVDLRPSEPSHTTTHTTSGRAAGTTRPVGSGPATRAGSHGPSTHGGTAPSGSPEHTGAGSPAGAADSEHAEVEHSEGITHIAHDITEYDQSDGDAVGRDRPLAFTVDDEVFNDDIIIITLQRSVAENRELLENKPPRILVNGVPYFVNLGSVSDFRPYYDLFTANPDLESTAVALTVSAIGPHPDTGEENARYDVESIDESRRRDAEAGAAGHDPAPHTPEHEGPKRIIAHEINRDTHVVRFESDPVNVGDTVILPIDRLMQLPTAPARLRHRLANRVLGRPLPTAPWNFWRALRFDLNGHHMSVDLDPAGITATSEIDQFFSDPANERRNIAVKITRNVHQLTEGNDSYRYMLLPLSEADEPLARSTAVIGNASEDLDRTAEHDTAAILASHDQIRRTEASERAQQEILTTGSTRLETGTTGDEARLEIDTTNPDGRPNVVYPEAERGSVVRIPVLLLGKPEEVEHKISTGQVRYKRIPGWRFNGNFTRMGIGEYMYGQQEAELDALSAMTEDELASEVYIIRILHKDLPNLKTTEYEIEPQNRPVRRSHTEPVFSEPEEPQSPLSGANPPNIAPPTGRAERPDYNEIFKRPDLSGEIAPEFGQPPVPILSMEHSSEAEQQERQRVGALLQSYFLDESEMDRERVQAVTVDQRLDYLDRVIAGPYRTQLEAMKQLKDMGYVLGRVNGGEAIEQWYAAHANLDDIAYEGNLPSGLDTLLHSHKESEIGTPVLYGDLVSHGHYFDLQCRLNGCSLTISSAGQTRLQHTFGTGKEAVDYIRETIRTLDEAAHQSPAPPRSGNSADQLSVGESLNRPDRPTSPSGKTLLNDEPRAGAFTEAPKPLPSINSGLSISNPATFERRLDQNEPVNPASEEAPRPDRSAPVINDEEKFGF